MTFRTQFQAVDREGLSAEPSAGGSGRLILDATFRGHALRGPASRRSADGRCRSPASGPGPPPDGDRRSRAGPAHGSASLRATKALSWRTFSRNCCSWASADGTEEPGSEQILAPPAQEGHASESHRLLRTPASRAVRAAAAKPACLGRLAVSARLRTEASQLSRPLLERRGWRVDAEETVTLGGVPFLRWRMGRICS